MNVVFGFLGLHTSFHLYPLQLLAPTSQYTNAASSSSLSPLHQLHNHHRGTFLLRKDFHQISLMYRVLLVLLSLAPVVAHLAHLSPGPISCSPVFPPTPAIELLLPGIE